MMLCGKIGENRDISQSFGFQKNSEEALLLPEIN